MHPLKALLTGLSMSSSTDSPTKSTSLGGASTPFWLDPQKVAALHDPPPSEFWEAIREQPWRGGLEPIDPMGVPLHQAILVEGSIPSDLVGTLYRNGPGRTRIGDRQYGHWFDSDGLVSKLCIDGKAQTVTFQANYVETERFLAQQDLDEARDGNTGVRMAKSGAWTKKGQGRWWENLFEIPTNPANTNVLFLDSETADEPPQLFALAEGGDPVAIDPATLETLGAKAFTSGDGRQKTDSFFSAHYKKDPKTGEIYNHGLILGPNPKINVMKCSPDGDLLLQSRRSIPVFGFVHDNLVSENYFLFLIHPFYAPDSALTTSLFGGEPVGNQFEWNPDGERLPKTLAFVYSKDTMECVAEVPLPHLSTYHTVDAFEDEDDSSKLTFRVLVHDPPNSRNRLEDGFKDLYRHSNLPTCMIQEYKVNVKDQTMIHQRRVAPTARLCELPDVNGNWAYRKEYLWTNLAEDSAGFLNALQKVNLRTEECSEIISFGPTTYATSPIFCPRSNPQSEDDGYIITFLYRSDEHRSDVCILDAATMEQVALLKLESHLTYPFHGQWYPGTF